jgi:endonuclease YncB( thermonuclease family)
VYGQRVKVKQQDRDRYGRIVGKVLANGADAGLRQIEAGLAALGRRSSDRVRMLPWL